MIRRHHPRTRRSAAALLTAALLAGLPSTTAAGADPPVPNHVDATTAGLEAGTGLWVPWFSTTVARSTAQAHTGSASLRVDVTGPYGWGVVPDNWPGFAATPGAKRISFWGLKGVGDNMGVTMRVTWRNSSNTDLQTDTVTVGALTTAWQQASADVTAPAGTARAWMEVTSSTGSNAGGAGDHLFLDDFVVGDSPAPPVVTNHVDAATSGIEPGTGLWATWFQSTVSRSTAQAQAGGASLRVDVTGPWGWGVVPDNSPGFAAYPGAKRISFWGRKGAGDDMGVTMKVAWRDSSNTDLRVDTVTVPSLSTTWQQATADVTAPPATARAWVEVTSSPGSNAGAAGDYLFLDQFVVGALTAAPQPGSGAPAVPPAPMCGSPALQGPAVQPPGSVRVDPGQDLHAATLAHGESTTFWLSPGVHTLGSGEYSQVAPRTGNTYIGAPDAVLDGQGVNKYAFTYVQPYFATGVTIRNLTIQNFVPGGSEGAVNQGAGSGWVVEYNTVRNNAGAGVFVGSDNVVRYNCLTANGRYGFSAYSISGGLSNIVLDHNEISYNNTDDFEVLDPTCGCTGGGKFWDVNGATVTNNWVHHNKSVGLWADTNNVAFRIEGNYINDNDGQAIFYEISYNFLIKDNTIKRNTWRTGLAFANRGDPFPIGTIYISESGGDARVSPTYATSEIVGNVLEDNWGGVALWESPSRFCNSPNNTSAAYCTKGGVATHAACTQPGIATEPLYSDCRWKTQNIEVHNNLFRFSAANVGCNVAYCGRQGVFSNVDESVPWAPYVGDTIKHAITFEQGNHFHDNAYLGDWSFVAFTHLPIGYTAWRAAPYSQDAGSSKL